MNSIKTASDAAVLAGLGTRLAAQRLLLNLTQAQLAEEAGVSKRSIERLESGAAATQLSAFLRVCRVLGLQDRIEQLVPEPSTSPVEQLKLKGRRRQRASGTADAVKLAEPAPKGWSWKP